MPKVKFGLSRAAIAVRTDNDGTITYAEPIDIPGAVSAAVERESDTSIFYADNTAYFTSNTKTSSTIDLEVADIPREVLTAILGYIEANGGGILETSNPVTPHFALLFEIQTDEKARRFCYYNCTAVESDEEYNTTEDTIEPTTSTLSITSTGDPVGEYSAFRQIVDSTDANYNTFFESVTAPKEKAEE